MKIIAPNSLKQLDALRSNCDIVWLTGAVGSGKTFAGCLYHASDILNNPEYKCLMIRKNIGQFFTNGGIVDTMESIYPLIKEGKTPPRNPIGTIVQSPAKMGIYFKKGASIKMMQINDENPEKLKDQFKGQQNQRIIIDEVDAFTFETVFYIITRIRGEAGKTRQQIICLQNPERDCFGRTMLGTSYNGVEGAGYIDNSGNVIEEMNGTVTYFYSEGSIDKIVYGKSKKEVYERAKTSIDKIISDARKNGAKVNYEDLILSMSFFSFTMFDNSTMDKSYLARVMNSIGASGLAKNNWNYSSKDINVADNEELRLTREDIERMFKGNHQYTGKIRITCDPAAEGIDNMVICAWDSFHLIDIEVIQKIDAGDIQYPIREFMDKHGATNQQLSIDIQKFEYLKKHFAGARFYNGSSGASNIGKKSYVRSKDEASYQMVRLIKLGIFSIDINLKDMRYKHQKDKRHTLTICEEIQEEAKIFIFGKGEYDRIKVQNKVEMGLGLRGKSPDILDNFVVFVGTQIYDIYKVLGNVNEFKRLRGIKDEDKVSAEMNKLIQQDVNKNFGLRRESNRNSVGSMPTFKTYSFEQFMKQLN